jgi:hypothetical protein
MYIPEKTLIIDINGTGRSTLEFFVKEMGMECPPLFLTIWYTTFFKFLTKLGGISIG